MYCDKKIFLISGKRTSGKDTCTDIIKKYFEAEGLNVCVISFAKILKECFCRDKNYDFDRMLNDYKYKEERRDEMTLYFLEMRKEKGEYFFCNYLMEYIDQSHHDMYIISDLRLRSDLEMIEKSTYSKYIVRVNATEDSKRQRGWTPKECDKEFTETDLDECTRFDIIFDNNSSLLDLECNITSWIHQICNPI